MPDLKTTKFAADHAERWSSTSLFGPLFFGLLPCQVRSEEGWWCHPSPSPLIGERLGEGLASRGNYAIADCKSLYSSAAGLLRFACPSGSRSVASTSWLQIPPNGANNKIVAVRLARGDLSAIASMQLCIEDAERVEDPILFERPCKHIEDVRSLVAASRAVSASKRNLIVN